MGRDPYLSSGNCIRILWQKMKYIQIIGLKWIHVDSDQINYILSLSQFQAIFYP